LAHLQARMRQSGHLSADVELTDGTLRQRLRLHFQQIDFQQAKDDVRPFIKDQAELTLWSPEFFGGLVDRLRTS
ncbi:MAG: nucleotidyl transferase AbiEii/AbiGii toxin family protein, partial [Anaerolineae bacterium]|nr:nucleotidyl transferase AbiEii/AbiGii toxin family protein [Anaerolineae bacterium]